MIAMNKPSNYQTIVLWVSLSLLAGLPSIGIAQTKSESSDGESGPRLFTESQASAGKAVYSKQCAVCHGEDLAGIHLSPSLIGNRFDRNWRGKSLGVLGFHLRRMPMKPIGEPGSLSDEDYTSVLAYLLAANGFSSGDDPLPSDASELAKLKLPGIKGINDDPDAPVAHSPRQQQLLSTLPPVTDAMLANPPAADWLYWGRTRNGHNYSPLDQINHDSVGRMQLAWRAPLRWGNSMPTPLVHHGVMYLQTFPDTVLAIDATNGEVLWRYQYKPVKTVSSQKMGLGLHGNKILVPTSDLHVQALDARTGEVIWDHRIQPETPDRVRVNYNLRSAPLIVGNKVIQGVTASMAPRGGFILALDVESGEELWRFNTIARPGTPGGNTWNGLELDARSGGSVWHQGTYDPELNLIYYGVAPTYDTGPLLRPVDQEGISNDALFTNCTIAINPDNGELVWHYQHMPNDQWDLDWAFERQIGTVNFNGESRKVVFNIGKMAVLEALDAATGEYLFSVDSGIQNVITDIDPETGKKTIDSGKVPDPSRDCLVCPNAIGARSWPPSSYHAESKLVYVPLSKWCMTMGRQGFRLLTSGVGISSAPHPKTSDDTLGRIQAINVEDRSLAWSIDQGPAPSTSIVATAGGLLFAGDIEPSLKAYDQATGKVLWSGAVDDLPTSSVVTYMAGDKQYVSIVVGHTNFHIRGLKGAYDELRSKSGQRPAPLPNGGAAIWTFTLDSTVREWTVADLAASLPKVDQSRDLANAAKVFESASCLACHAVSKSTQNAHGKLAPSLAEISKKVADGKLDRAGLLREIIEPSHQIDEKYRTNVVTTVDGRLISGVVLQEDDDVIRLLVESVESW